MGVQRKRYAIFVGQADESYQQRFISGFFRGQQGTTEFKRTLAVTKDWNSTYSLLLDWRSYFERGIV